VIVFLLEFSYIFDTLYTFWPNSILFQDVQKSFPQSNTFNTVWEPVPSPRGGIWWAYPPNKAPS